MNLSSQSFIADSAHDVGCQLKSTVEGLASSLLETNISIGNGNDGIAIRRGKCDMTVVLDIDVRCVGSFESLNNLRRG